MNPESRVRFQVEDSPRSGEANMEIDRQLLARVEQTPEPQTWIRFYRWETPTVSLGKHQVAEKAVDSEFCRRNGIPIVSRPTGGRAVLHGRELTYSVVSNDARLFPSGGISQTYGMIAEALRDGLARLGIVARIEPSEPSRSRSADGLPTPCFMTASRHELVFAGRKLVGSAQRRLRRSFLQHGSIPLHIDYSLMAGALGSDAAALKEKVISVSEAAGKDISYKKLAESLKEAFARRFQLP